MSYLTKTQNPQRRAGAIVAVGAIHAAIGYVLVTGLGVQIYDRLAPPPLVGFDVPLPPPPPDPEPVANSTEEAVATTPVAPVPPVILTNPPPVQADPIASDTVVFPDPIPVARPEPPNPPPAFTPRRPRPANEASGWITTNDYPARQLRSGIEGTAGYRLVIGSDGRVSACEITASSGDSGLDAATCRLIQRRARFEPATDRTGARVVGTYTGTVRWRIPG